MNSVGVGILIGLVFLILFCSADYKKRFGRSSTILAFSISLVLFLSLNIAMYWLLCWLFLEHYPTDYLFGMPPDATEPDVEQVLTPVIFAIMYFGTGAATFRFKNFEFNAYEKIFEAFSQLFRVTLSFDQVKQMIRESKVKRDHYKRIIERLHEDQEFDSSARLQENWENANRVIDAIDNHSDNLFKIKSDIENCPKSDCRLKELSADIVSKKIDLANEIVKCYELYLKKFIEENNVSRKKIVGIFLQEGIPMVSDKPDETNSIIIQTSLTCFFAGLFLGPIFKTAGEEKEIILYSFRGAFSLSVVGLVLSYHFKKTGLLIYLLLRGTLAGYLGYFIISIKSFQHLSSWASISDLAIHSFKGIPYGASIGFSLYLYAKYSSLIQNRIVNCLALGFSGGILLNIAYCFFEGFRLHPRVMIFGFIVNLFVGWGLGLYAGAKSRAPESST